MSGDLAPGCGMPWPLLKTFPVEHEGTDVSIVKTFGHGNPDTPEDINTDMALRGSSAPTDILVHPFYDQTFLGILHRDILSGEVEVCIL